MTKVVVWLSVVLFAVGAPAAYAANWGAAKTAEDLSIFCTELDRFSECTPVNMEMTFYESVTYPFTDAELEARFRNSLANDYDDLPNVSATWVTHDLLADVKVYQHTTNPAWDMAYTTCGAGAATNYENIRYYRWCSPQLIYIQDDPSAYTQCWNDTSCTKHFMCHEIGHTFGLQRTGRNTSCMEDTITLAIFDLDDHDRDHLDDCFPRPAEAGLPVWPADARTALCKEFE